MAKYKATSEEGASDFGKRQAELVRQLTDASSSTIESMREAWAIEGDMIIDKDNMWIVLKPKPMELFRADSLIVSLFTHLIARKQLVNFRNVLMLYWEDLNEWFLLSSIPASRYIANVVKANNATVNFVSVVVPYMPYLESSCEHVGKNLRRSMNVSKCRFEIKIEGQTMILKPNQEMVSCADKIGRTIAFKSLSYSLVSRRVLMDRRMGVKNYIQSLLGDRHTQLLMYAIGCAHVDPVRASYIVLLVDPEGGKGKSTLMEVLKNVMSGTAAFADKDEIGGKSTHLSEAMIRLISKYRVVITQDVEWEDHALCMKYIKALVTIDSRYTDAGEIPNGVLFLCGSNRMPFFSPKDMNAARFRRFIVIPYTPEIQFKRTGWDVPMFTDEEKLTFMCQCVAVSETNESPPFTTESFLYTLFGAMAGRKVRGMTIDEEKATDQDSIVGTEVIKIVSRIKPQTLDSILHKYATSILDMQSHKPFSSSRSGCLSTHMHAWKY